MFLVSDMYGDCRIDVSTGVKVLKSHKQLPILNRSFTFFTRHKTL